MRVGQTLTLGQLKVALENIPCADATPIRLICDGTAFAAPDVWVEPHQEHGLPAVCIGDDPR